MQPILPTGKAARQTGFTLLELMLIVLVIGLLSGVVAHTLAPARDDQADLFKSQLLRFLRSTQQQAVFSGSEFALLFSHNRLSPLEYTEDGWQAVIEISPLERPERLSWTLEIEGNTVEPQDEDNLTQVIPQLIFYSDGQYSPFKMTLSGTDGSVQSLDGLFQQRTR
ncbi:MAG: GspH/FimT family pseudopilin [Pontibacterium sp.]